MNSPMYPIPSLTVEDYKLFVSDKQVFPVSLPLEAYAIISMMVDADIPFCIDQMRKACSDSFCGVLGVPRGSFAFPESRVLDIVLWLKSVGILKAYNSSSDSRTMMNQFVFEDGFRHWLSECGDVVHSNISHNPQISAKQQPQPHAHAAFSELADTAILDPRLRDILMDMRHMGEKADRVLTGS